MYGPKIKNEAIRLRKGGNSIKRISLLLNLSSSTVSFWCRDIVLSEDAIKKISLEGDRKLKKSLLEYSEKVRSQRIQRFAQSKVKGAGLVKSLSQRELFLVGLGLYWGEGYKESNTEMGFTNTNPGVISFYLRWLRSLGIEKDRLIFRLTINKSFKNNADTIKNFWVNFLNVGMDQFSATTIIKTKLKKTSKADFSNYKGTLRVKVRKAIDLKNEIMGALEELSK